jgi:hypothetical protein
MSPPHRLAFVFASARVEGTCASSVPLVHGRAPLPVIFITAIIASAPTMIFHVCCNLTRSIARAMPGMMIVGHRGAAVRLLQGHTRGRDTCGLSCVPSVCSMSTAWSASVGDQNWRA